MAIPENLTHAEVGAFLVAVGTHMIDHDVCAGAVVEPHGMDDEAEYIERLVDKVNEAHWPSYMERERAHEIITTLTLAEAIEFVQLPERSA